MANGVKRKCPGCGWGRMVLTGEASGHRPVNAAALVFLWILGIGCIAGSAYGLFYFDVPLDTPKRILIFVVVWIFYVLAAVAFDPDPDMNDLGWFGGMMNNPFSLSDDYNQMLLFFKIVLIPGNVVLQAVLGTFRLIMKR